jgi:hypothetical protein
VSDPLVDIGTSVQMGMCIQLGNVGVRCNNQLVQSVVLLSVEDSTDYRKETE